MVVILAAGQGTRMRSALPKMLHPLCGRPLVRWPLQAALDAGAAQVILVGGPDRALEPVLESRDGRVTLAVQDEARGTGDALRAALEHLVGGARTVIVLAGDVPLITAEAIGELATVHEGGGVAATMATMVLEDPTGYGRVVRGSAGEVERVAETKRPGDATPDELAVHEVNTGVLAFDVAQLRPALAALRAHNAQGELYLPDVLPALRGAGHAVRAHRLTDPTLMLGVNDRVDLARVRAHAQRRICETHMRAGVTVVDPAATTIDADVAIGRDTVIHPGGTLHGATRVGEGCEIGPHTTLTDTTLGDGVRVAHSVLVEATVDEGASVGPFAYLRPDAHLHAGAKAGTFVEIKGSEIGPGAKVPHLSYIGDADVGERANLGAGTITANYDGARKHRTRIGDRVKGAVHVSYVAPVSVGDDAYTAAGSAITADVPPGALGIARPRQSNVAGYAARRRGEDGDAS